MFKIYLFIETVILLFLYLLIYTPIKVGCGVIFKLLTVIHDTADFYSENDIHFFQPSKAREIYNKAYEEQIKKAGGGPSNSK